MSEDIAQDDAAPTMEPTYSMSNHFTKNNGQWHSGLDYVGKTGMGYIGLNKEGVYFNIIKEVEDDENGDPRFTGHILELTFEDSNTPWPTGGSEIGAKYNYLIGDQPNWVTHVPNYLQISYPEIWDCIDITYRYSDNDLKYDIILKPGADPSDIKMTMKGQKGMDVVDRSLVIDVDGEATMVDRDLDVFYLDDPTEKIDASFIMVDGDTYSFDIDEYDHGRTVVIDPFYYGTYLGSYGSDYAWGIGVDGNLNAYAMGYTTYSSSGEFPTTPGAYQQYRSSTSYDAFITKFHYSGKDIYYSTFIGGYNSDYCYGGTADKNGYAYITGYTYYSSSGNYPSTKGAFQSSINTAYSTSYYDAFVTKLSQDGSSLIFSTFLGGAYYEYGYGIDVDSDGYVYVSGNSYYSASVNPTYGEFPVTSGAFLTSRTNYMGYAAKFNPSGSSLVWATFVGGNSTSSNYCYDIASDDNGNGYPILYTGATDFPTTSGAYQASNAGGYDVGAVKLRSSTGAAVWATYVGGSSTDYARGVDVDTSGNVYLSGYTASSNYPVTSGAYDTTYNNYEIFVTKLNSNGNGLTYSTFLGTDSSDYTYYHNIKVNSKGNAFVAGYTSSSGYPLTSDYVQDFGGSTDVVMTNLSADGASLSFSTYLGGSSSDYPYAGIEIDKTNTMYVAGYTSSSDFPTISGAYDTTYTSTDVFVARLGTKFDDRKPPTVTDTTTNMVGYTGQPFTVTATSSDNVGVMYLTIESWSGTRPHANTTMSILNGKGSVIIPDSVDTFYWFVSAGDYHGNWANTTTKSLVPIDATGPTFSNVGSNPYPPLTGGSVNLTVDVKDNVALDPTTVTLYFRDSRTPSYTSVPMTQAGSSNTFYYVGTVSTYWDGIYFYFRAADYSNNIGISSTYYQAIYDNVPPTFVSDDSETSASTGDTFWFSLTLNDNIGIGYAYVEYWYGAGSHSQRSLTLYGSGFGTDQAAYTSITVSYNTAGPLYYFYDFRDRQGNWWASGPSSTVTVPVDDNDPPNLVDLKMGATTGDQFSFEVMFDDNIDGPAIYEASVEYCYDDDWMNSRSLDLTYDSDSEYWTSTAITVPHSLDPITLVVTGTDHNDNTLEEGGYIPVIDNDYPVINSDTTPASGTTGDPLNFTMNTDDNIAIGTVLLSMRYGTERVYNDIPMSDAGSGNYYSIVKIAHSLAPLYYNFTVVDTSGNTITSKDKTIDVSDNDLPDVVDMTRKVAKAGEKDFPIKAVVIDNIELNTLKLEYWFSFDPTVRQVSMSSISPGVYYYHVDLPLTSGTMSVRFTATDTPAGNIRVCSSVIEILDTTPPEISGVTAADTAYTGDEYSISATITDDIGVTDTRLYYSFGTGTPIFTDLTSSGNTYSSTLSVPHALAPLFFWIEAWDQEGNRMTTEIIMVSVEDNDLPMVEADLSDTDALTGDPLMLRMNATDNIGVGRVDVSLRYPGGEWETHTMMLTDRTYYMEVIMQNEVVGTFSYYFTVYDTSMNMVMSEQVDIEVVDDEQPIAVMNAPSSAFQHEEVTFTATGSEDNIGILTYKWEINGESLEGSEITYTFQDVGNYAIELKVSDGVTPSVSCIGEIVIMDADDPQISVEVPTMIGNHMVMVADASGSTDNVGVVSYSWLLILPDHTKRTGDEEVFEFDLAGMLGNLTLHLTIKDAMGNSASSVFEISSVDLLPPEVKAPQDASSYKGALLQFSDQGSTDNIGIKTYMWTITLDDMEEVLYGKTISYLFEEAGLYNITLTVLDPRENSASDNFFVTIIEKDPYMDSDGDGILDWWEDENGLNKDVDDGSWDNDRDLLTNLLEYQLGTDPNDPDTDGDQLPDNWEYKYGYNAGKTDIVNGAPRWMNEFGPDDDPDDDGDTNLEEYLQGHRDPNVADAREGEKKDNTMLVVVIALIVILLIAVVLIALIMVLGKVKPVEDEFPQEEFPHLYKNE
ncbi:MAG: SBBP repeat-containing protein [Candidatus Thermoplasmatota archaeon]|nr:SBBP repeat-containing protein [Candidatus Thermoplasmatota archaeon]